MPEATINKFGGFVCGECHWLPKSDVLYVGGNADIHFSSSLLDDLYALLHARHMAQAYDKKYMAKVAKAMKDDKLYEADEVTDARSND